MFYFTVKMHHPSCFMHWGCSLVDPQLWQLLNNVMMKFLINDKTDIFVLRHTIIVFLPEHAIAPPPLPWKTEKDYWVTFTVLCSVTWSLNGSKAGGDLSLIQTSRICCVNQVVLMLTRSIYMTKAERRVSKQGHLQACCHSKARSPSR